MVEKLMRAHFPNREHELAVENAQLKEALGLRNKVERISFILRDAAEDGFSRITINGATWVRANAGSPEEDLAFYRGSVADLITQVDQLAQRINELEDALTPFIVWFLLRREEPRKPKEDAPILEAKAPLIGSDALYTVTWQHFLDAYKVLENAEEAVDNCTKST